MGLSAALLGGIAFVAAAFLIVFTTLLHAEMRRTIVALDGVEEAARIEYLLRQHRVTRSEENRAVIERLIRENLARAQGRARGPLELTANRELLIESDKLFAVRRAQAPIAELNEQAQRTYDAIARTIELEVASAHEAEVSSARWDRTANVAGIVVALTLAVGAALAFIRLRQDVLKPLFGLSAVMARHGAGSLGARATEDGVLELREMARRFNEMADAQARRQREQLDFVASLAHDLRTPLGVLTTSTRLATQHQGEERERILTMIARQADRLNRLIDDLLDTARIQAGRLSLELGRVDLVPLASEIVTLFHASSPDRQFVLDAHEGPLEARCDSSRVSQVLNNLLSNAVKYSPETSPVEIALGKEGELVVIRVRDEGIGLSQEELSELFLPYRRTKRGGSYASGSGLGLYGVKRVVEAHGGTISAESTVGHGTTFIVRLPIAGPSSTAPAGAELVADVSLGS